MSNTTYYQKNRDVILNRANSYENNKKKVKRARDSYRNLSEEDKNKKREYGRKKQIPYYVWRKETKTKIISKKLPWDQKIKTKNFPFFLFIV